jgi:hypothetical protein
MSDGLVAAMILVVGFCFGVFDGPLRWSFPAVKAKLRLCLDLWRRWPMAGGPVVMVFFDASLAHLLFRAYWQNRCYQFSV